MVSIFDLRQSWPVLLIFMAVFSQPIGVSFELFTLIMALLGARTLWSRPSNLNKNVVRVFSILFACIWIPGCLSLVDAIEIKRGLITQIGYLRFYLAGVFVIHVMNSESRHMAFAIALSFLLFFWILDAWVQLMTGSNLFGMVGEHVGRISGVFGKRQILGWIVILYGSVVTGALLHYRKYFWVSLAVPLLVGTVFISGTRGAWLGCAWIIASLALMLIVLRVNVEKKHALITFLLSCGVLIGVMQYQSVQDRLDDSFDFTSHNFEQWNQATSYRLSLWATTTGMIEANWLNGVGVKSFRYAYPEYAQAEDPLISLDSSGRKKGAHHAHQIVMDALATSGLFGLVGLSIFFGMLVSVFLKVFVSRQCLPAAYSLALVGVLFPLNSHISIYSSYWAQMVWLMIALMLACRAVFQQHVDPAR